MEAAFGVHFGCTSACLAVNKEGKTDVIANDSGERTTPCIVAFTDHDQAVGAAAKQGIIRNAQNSVCHVKQVLGRTFDNSFVTDYKRKSAVTVIDKNGFPYFEVEYKEAKKIFPPSQIAMTIYKKMLETAQSHGGSGIHDCVLAVPLYFTAEQRKAVSTAATEAGFNVLRLISEPVACVMAYDIGQADNTTECQVLVFRLGGISAEASIVKVQNGMYRMMASNTDHSFGGDRFTEELVNFLAQEFQRQNRHDIKDNKRSMAKLYRGAENCKHTLSKLDNAHCAVESLYEGIDFNTKVSRARFESVASELIQKCTELIDRTLREGNISRNNVDKLILCGGGSCIPAVQRAVCGMFNSAEILNQLSPEEVIAIGAAKQAGVLLGLEEEDIQMNASSNEIECLSKDICIKGLNETGVYYHPVFTKFSPLHSRRKLEHQLGEGQTSFMMEVCECSSLEGEDDITAVTLAKIVMRELPAGCTVSSTFHLRREGSLHITCSEPTTNKTESVTVDAES